MACKYYFTMIFFSYCQVNGLEVVGMDRSEFSDMLLEPRREGGHYTELTFLRQMTEGKEMPSGSDCQILDYDFFGSAGGKPSELADDILALQQEAALLCDFDF